MAIETINKKIALIAANQPWQPALPISSDGIDTTDQYILIWQYPQIAYPDVETAVFWSLCQTKIKAYPDWSRGGSVLFDIGKSFSSLTIINESASLVVADSPALTQLTVTDLEPTECVVIVAAESPELVMVGVLAIMTEINAPIYTMTEQTELIFEMTEQTEIKFEMDEIEQLFTMIEA
jgi:hypothetical protein